MTYERLDAPRFRKTTTTAWADQIGPNFDALWPERPTVSLTRSAATACPNLTPTSITWTDEDWQVDAFWTSGATLTSPRSGFYQLIVVLDWEANTDGFRSVAACHGVMMRKGSDSQVIRSAEAARELRTPTPSPTSTGA